MRNFFGLLAIVVAILLSTKPDQAVPIIATSLIVVGLLILLPESSSDEK